MNSELFNISPAALPLQYTDRLTLTSYQDEAGAIVWHSVAGTLTDSKGKRWHVASRDDSASLASIEHELFMLRHDEDAEFWIKYELLTIRG